jgi:tRNA A-37 threonylcarbamoyl transferase component Bud32
MIRFPLFRRIIWLLCVASGVLFFVTATASAAAAATDEPPPPRPPLREEGRDYFGSWSYKWGDSPRDEHGALQWLRAGATEFTPLDEKAGTRLPGRNGQRFVWLRTKLQGPDVHDPTLYVEIVDQIFEAYLDGQRIHTYGDLDGTRRFIGYPAHFIPLGDDYRGRTLTLRIYSDHLNIGVFGRLRIGSKARLITEALRQDVGKIAVGLVLCAIGIFVFFLYFNERRESAYLHYAVFALTVGIWVLCQMRVRSLIVDWPLMWTHLECFSLYTTAAAVSLFLSRALDRGPLGLLPILAYVFIAYDLGAALLVATGTVGVLRTLLPFQLLFGFSLVYALVAAAIGLRRGNIEARLFAVGLALTATFGIYDLLMAVGILPRVTMSLSYFGHGGFAIALGAILVHRFRLVHRDLVLTKQALSDKVSALESRNTEVEQLNDELRRQIEARSKQLISSLLGDGSSSQGAIPIFAEGSLLSDRYRVLRTLGQGAMGIVYEVERVQDSRHFAAKVLSGRARRQELARFAREAQVLARLKHRNLVTIADVDVTNHRLAYIIMELVVGTTLAAKTQHYGQLPFVLPVLRQLADALQSVHAEGVVHRDLKPANILITRGEDRAEPMIKVVDFGVSALDSSDELAPAEADTLDGAQVTPAGLVTQTGVIMGTPLYMAPELIRGAKLARSDADMFSFGIIAYELLTGQLPSETPPIMLLLKPHVRWYTPLSQRCPDLPAELCQLIEQCLDAGPENRPTAAQLYTALRDAGSATAAADTALGAAN